ncbi:MAG: LytTR family transcriptional regulator, partial [Planctomycetota bacterium]
MLEATEPAPWAPPRDAFYDAIAGLTASETVWFHDGLSHSDRDTEGLDALSDLGPMTLIGPEEIAHGLTPPRLDQGQMAADVLRAGGDDDTRLVYAYARSEAGGERRIAVAPATFGARDPVATATFDLPPELISTVTRLVLATGPSAGGAVMADGSLSRLPTGLVVPVTDDAIVSLTSASHYLREALEPWSIIREGTLPEIMQAPPAVLVMADHGAFTDEDQERLGAWIEEGGLMIRFAGPRLAASIGERFGAAEADPLLPVRLRRGGRVLGGALAWSKPRT